MIPVMWTVCLVLLLPPPPVSCGSHPSQGRADRRHGLRHHTYPLPHTTERKPKQDAGKLITVIDVSDDVDFEPEYTYASLTKPDMPEDFTICGAFRLKAWTIKFLSAYLYQMNYNGSLWSYVELKSEDVGNSTDFTVKFGNIKFLLLVQLVFEVVFLIQYYL